VTIFVNCAFFEMSLYYYFYYLFIYLFSTQVIVIVILLIIIIIIIIFIPLGVGKRTLHRDIQHQDMQLIECGQMLNHLVITALPPSTVAKI